MPELPRAHGLQPSRVNGWRQWGASWVVLPWHLPACIPQADGAKSHRFCRAIAASLEGDRLHAAAAYARPMLKEAAAGPLWGFHVVPIGKDMLDDQAVLVGNDQVSITADSDLQTRPDWVSGADCMQESESEALLPLSPVPCPPHPY